MPTTPVPLVRPARTWPALALVAAIGAGTGCATSESAGPMTGADAPAGPGRMVEATGSLMQFAPEASFGTVDLDRLDLKSVFEEIGEAGTLWYQHVQTLANPFFEGRMPGTRGHALAADYIEFNMRNAGLLPAFTIEDDESGTVQSYRQLFEFITDAVAHMPHQAVGEDSNKIISQHDDRYDRYVESMVFYQQKNGESGEDVPPASSDQ